MPALLVRHQARLQLSNAEMIYLLHILSHRWDGKHWPWVAVSTIAEAVGAHRDIVRRWKASLIAKGYLRTRMRVVPGVGRRADEHDLSRLFAALEALSVEEETHKALDQIRRLPEAQYDVGQTAPKIVPRRSGKKIRARAGENTGSHTGENTGSPFTKSPGREPVKTPAEVEPGKETTTRTRPKSPSQKPGQRVAAARPEQSDPAENDSIDINTDDATPGYLDEGITSYILEWGPELGDDDQDRSLDRAHRLWWNSKLERWRFHNKMKAAKHATVSRMAKGQVNGRPMAYFFGVLAGAAADQCVKAGLPIPRGWERAVEGNLEHTASRQERSDDQSAAE